LTGERSLHQLIDTATSRGGSDRLRTWLLDPLPDIAGILRRQALLQELLPLAGLRNRLALHGMLVKAETTNYWEGDRLLQWLEASAAPRSLLPVLTLLFVLAAANLSLYILNALAILPPYWMLTLAAYGGVYLFKYGAYRNLFEDAYTLGKALKQFRAIMELEGLPLDLL
jgi:hypothetical protein